MLQKLQERDFRISAMSPGSFLVGEFFNKYLGKCFVVKMKKTLVIMSQKLLYWLCIC